VDRELPEGFGICLLWVLLGVPAVVALVGFVAGLIAGLAS
jgi:hypothetical protein